MKRINTALLFSVIAFCGFTGIVSCSKLKGTHACMDFYPSPAKAGEAVTFLSGCSKKMSSFSWDFGDGTTSTEKNPDHTYQATGSYVITMVASDGSISDTAQSLITVTP